VVWQFWGRAAGRPELKSSGRFFSDGCSCGTKLEPVGLLA